jgi:hypothetical protein
MNRVLIYGDGLTKADIRRFGPGAGAREARYFDGIEPCSGVVVLTMHGTFIERITSAYTKAGIPIISGPEDVPGPLAVATVDGTLSGAALLGTDSMPAVVDIGGREVQLGDIVRRAYENSGAPSAEAWNAADASSRDVYINAALEQMRAEAGPVPVVDLAPEAAPPAAPKKRTYTRRAVKAPPEV